MCNDVPSLSVCLIRSPFLFSRSIPHSYSNSTILIFSSISQSRLFLDQLSLVQYVHTTRYIFFSFASLNFYEVLFTMHAHVRDIAAPRLSVKSLRGRKIYFSFCEVTCMNPESNNMAHVTLFVQSIQSILCLTSPWEI